jgi:AraC-like DNA-binding protein
MSYGYRNFRKMPDVASVRYNWIFLVSLDGQLHPQFLDAGIPAISGTANFFIIPPNVTYVLQSDHSDCFRAVFHYSHVPDLLSGFVIERGIFHGELNVGQLAQVREMASGLVSEYKKQTELSTLVYEAALMQMSLLALRTSQFKEVSPLSRIGKERVSDALKWYCEHIRESPSLSDIANTVNVSLTQLRRNFQKELGLSPQPVLMKLRMQLATRLLSLTSDTLDQIADQCGFQAATDFCRAFKKELGVTPNRWRHDVNESRKTDKLSIGLDHLWD